MKDSNMIRALLSLMLYGLVNSVPFGLYVRIS